MSRTGVIGRGGALPWKLPDDMQHFRAVTRGGVLIHGRGVWDELGRQRLPGRSHVVLSRSGVPEVPGMRRASSPEEALALWASLAPGHPAFLVGGAQVYAALGHLPTLIWVTQVHAHVEGDVFLPDFPGRFEVVSSEFRPADAQHVAARTFRLLRRVTTGGRLWPDALVWGACPDRI